VWAWRGGAIGVVGDHVDDLVGQTREIGGLPVVVPSVRDGVVDAALVIDVERGPDEVHERAPELAERTNGSFTFVHGSGVTAGDRDRRPEVQLVADDRQRRGRARPGEGARLGGAGGVRVAAEERQSGWGEAAR